MADLHIPTTRIRRFRERMSEVLFSTSIVAERYVAGASVAAAAIALAALHIELQYVVGGFILVYAQTLARKRFSRDVSYTVPEPAPIRQSAQVPAGYEKMFGVKRDPIADALDR